MQSRLILSNMSGIAALLRCLDAIWHHAGHVPVRASAPRCCEHLSTGFKLKLKYAESSADLLDSVGNTLMILPV